MKKIAPKAYIIFCDDVRDEVGSKMSLMGIYSGQLVLPKVPLTLRTFNVVVFFEELKKTFKKFRIVFSLPGAKPIDLTGTPPPNQPDKNNVNIVFGLSPLKIEETGMANVKIFIDDVETPEIERGLEIIISPAPNKK